ncbi:MAG: 50S ribosomal protein L11 methyltransferase [Myxococcota bacterium]|nr:50S ribosomal protein L11 methyltransferase [Myxococcota bacterium]
MKTTDRRLVARVDSQDLADRVLAEVWAAGALGVEERSGSSGIELIIYLDRPAESTIRDALLLFGGEGLRVGDSEDLGDDDWTEAWKEGLDAIVISSRLVVRPSFVEHVAEPGQQEIVVDPGQAFGTGGHESTRLALGWVDELVAGSRVAGRVLDVGTGSGVLALAALRLGADWALGFDLDRAAILEARQVAARNELADRLELFAGPIACLGEGTFDLVVANLLRAEVIPIARDIARTVSREGSLVLSGLLESDRGPVLEAFASCGLEPCGERSLRDASGALWIAPRLVRSP